MFHQFNEATVFVGSLNLDNAEEDEIKYYSNDSESMVGEFPRPEATGLRPLTSNNLLKKQPSMESRPVTRNGSHEGLVFNLPPRPMTQQNERLRTPGYEEMLNRRAKFERIVTPAHPNSRIDALKSGFQAPKSPSKMEILKNLRQSPDVGRPSTSSGLPNHSYSNANISSQSQQHLPQSFSVSSEIKKETEAVPLDDIAERVVKLLKERNYSTNKKVLDFIATL